MDNSGFRACIRVSGKEAELVRSDLDSLPSVYENINIAREFNAESHMITKLSGINSDREWLEKLSELKSAVNSEISHYLTSAHDSKKA